MDSPVAADSSDFYLDQPVLHHGRRATFLSMRRGAAIIRYWGDSHAHSVPLETLSRMRMTGPGGSRRPRAATDEPITRER